MKVLIGPYPGRRSKKDRKVSIRIDKYDSWSADATLAMIAVPLLKQLKATKHGAPNVDHEDVPAYLRPTKKQIAKYNETGHTDPKFFDRWDWIMFEMIWALNEIAEGHPGEKQFHSGKSDWKFVPIDKDGKEVPEEGAEWFRMDKGPKDTYKLDKKGYTAYHARIQNGCRLFGKYFQSLWD